MVMSSYGIVNRGDFSRVLTSPPRPEPQMMPTLGAFRPAGTSFWMDSAAAVASWKIVGCSIALLGGGGGGYRYV